MKIKKMFAGALAAGALLLFSAFPAFAAGLADVQTPPADVLSGANDFAKQLSGMPDSEYFVESNTEGDILRYGTLILPEEGNVHYLAWGPWHNDPTWDGAGGTKTDLNNNERARYLGYDLNGESISNTFFPPDRSGNWKPLSDANLVAAPWFDKAVSQAFPQFFGPLAYFDGKTDPNLINSMRVGLDYCATGNQFTYPDPNSDLYQNPQKYIHVFLPPSSKTYGEGVMFNRDPDGSLWYRSVPLTDLTTTKINPDDAISLDPAERTGNPGDPAAFVLKVNWKDIKPIQQIASDFGYDMGFLVQVSHQTGGNPNAAAFTLDGAQSQDAGNGWAQIDYTALGDASKTGSVTVHVQNAPSEVVAQIVPYLKQENNVILLNEFYLHKQAEAKVKVKTANLIVTDISLDPNPGTPSQPTNGIITVQNESDEAFTATRTVWRVRHSDGTILDENTIVTDLAPGEVKALYLSFVPGNADNYSVAAMINPDHDNPPNEVNWLNSDWPGDNRVEVSYPVEEPCTDISVVSPYFYPSGTRYAGHSTKVGATVARANDGPAGPVDVTVTASGPDLYQTKTLSLGRGESQEIAYVVTVNQPGQVTYTFQAEPVGIVDCTPGNNSASVTFNVKEIQGMAPPESSQTWSEITGSK